MTLDDLPVNNVAVQVQSQDIPIFGVEVLGQDTPFGGVQILQNDDTVQVDFGGNGSGGGNGNRVLSVFTRIGDVVALRSDYAAFYQPLDSDLTQIARHGLPWINVVDYGAVADDSTDNTVVFNAALAAAAPGQVVFVPPGTYVVNGDINVPGLRFLVGSGNFSTELHVTADTQTNGLINLLQGSTLRNIVIIYDQPDHAGYTAVDPYFQTFVQYKPAISINSIPRGATVESVRIIKAWDGIRFLGNGGRSYVRNLEMSMFNRGIDIDGPQDTVRMENIHVWPFGLGSAEHLAAFYAPGHSMAFYVGRCDGLHISNLMAINGGGVDAHMGTGSDPAPPNIYFTSCVFDSDSAIHWSAGSGFFNNCFFSSAQPEAQNSFVLTDGIIMISNSRFFGGATGGWLQVNGGTAQLSNCRFDWVKWKVAPTIPAPAGIINDEPAIVATTGSVQVNGSYFNRVVDVDYTTPIINVTGGYAAILGNVAEDKGIGTGAFLNLTSSDAHHIVAGNKAIGWTINWPASSAAAIAAFGNQLSTSTGSTGQNQSLGVKQLYLEGGSSSNLRLLSGSGSPEGVVTADPGSLYLDTSISSAGNYAKKTGTGNTGWSATGTGGGGGTPGGANTQIQFNDSSAFGGDADLTWNKTTNLLSISGQQTITLDNNDYTNTSGANSHLLLWNNSGSQNAVTSYIAGAVRAKWRTDSSGNISWVSTATAANTGHHFFLGGDYGAGLDALFISYSEAATQTPNNWKYAWTSGSGIPAIASGGIDTALSRNGAGIVEINNGTAGTFRDLKARNIAAQTGGAHTGSGSVPTGGAAGQVLKKNTTTDYDVVWGTVTGGTGDLNFVFTQVAPSASWAVAHNLGKFPAVSVVDSGGTEIIPNVLYVDSNNVTVSFGSATSGKAYCN